MGECDTVQALVNTYFRKSSSRVDATFLAEPYTADAAVGEVEDERPRRVRFPQQSQQFRDGNRRRESTLADDVMRVG